MNSLETGIWISLVSNSSHNTPFGIKRRIGVSSYYRFGSIEQNHQDLNIVSFGMATPMNKKFVQSYVLIGAQSRFI